MVLKIIGKIPEKACPDGDIKSGVIQTIKVNYHIEDVERISFISEGCITEGDCHVTAAS